MIADVSLKIAISVGMPYVLFDSIITIAMIAMRSRANLKFGLELQSLMKDALVVGAGASAAGGGGGGGGGFGGGVIMKQQQQQQPTYISYTQQQHQYQYQNSSEFPAGDIISVDVRTTPAQSPSAPEAAHIYNNRTHP